MEMNNEWIQVGTWTAAPSSHYNRPSTLCARIRTVRKGFGLLHLQWLLFGGCINFDGWDRFFFLLLLRGFIELYN